MVAPESRSESPGVLHPDLPHHLADDDLDVLVVGVNALLTVHLLHLADQIVVTGGQAADAQHLVGGQGALGELVALGHHVAVLDAEAGGIGQGIGHHLAVVGGDGHVAHDVALGLFNGHPAADLGQLGHLLGLTGLEQLLHSGQTLSDVAAGHAAGVESTHGQLGSGLSDGLGGDDTHRLAGAYRLTDGQVDAVALGAHAAAWPGR